MHDSYPSPFLIYLSLKMTPPCGCIFVKNSLSTVGFLLSDSVFVLIAMLVLLSIVSCFDCSKGTDHVLSFQYSMFLKEMTPARLAYNHPDWYLSFRHHRHTGNKNIPCCTVLFPSNQTHKAFD